MTYCTADDAEELAAMAKEIWLDHYVFLDFDEISYILNKFQSEEAIREQIGSGQRYLFIMDGDVKAGYCSFRTEGDALFISKYYVRKEHRGKGLGSAALRGMLDAGREMGLKKALLWVNKQNAVSIELYTRKGFRNIDAVKKHIGDGFYLDDYVMEYLL